MFVSVVLPAYNAEAYVRESIESVLAQSHADFELILLNDGSTDGTLEILREYESRDERIHVLTHENHGIAPTLNRGVTTATADWIAVMHADDVMEPNRLERQIEFVSQHPDLAVTSCFVAYIDAQGRIMGRHSSELTTDEAVRNTRSREVVIGFHHPGVMMRKRDIEAVGLYRQEFWPAEDLDLWNRIADAGGRILVQPEYLVRYRIHDAAASVREARLVRQKFNWIKQCTLDRRSGRPEPTLEKFLDARRALPVHQRINEERKDLAQVLYKQGAFTYSLNRRVKSGLMILASSALDPLYAPKQVWHKFIRPRFRSGPVASLSQGAEAN
jgi:glycosyltransferase involved in cell wall biosynthesis